eukprot:542441-Ditylum_brightwellii.AAC.1
MFTEYLINDDSDPTWAKSFIHMDDDGNYIAECIKQGKAISVGDGSYDNGISAVPCIIKEESPFLHRITTNTSSS